MESPESAAVFLAQGDYAAAIALAQQHLRADPHNRSHVWSLGLALLLDGQIEAATATWEAQLTQASPEERDGWLEELISLLKGEVQRQQAQEHLAEAEQIYRQLLRYRPQWWQALQNLAIVLLKQQRLPEAATYYQQVLALVPDHPQVHHDLGYIYQNQGQIEAAIDYYQTTLRLDPQHISAHYNLGLIYRQQQAWEAATTCFQHVVALDPNQADARFQLGWLAQTQGQAFQAATLYRQAIQLQPAYLPYQQQLATCLKAIQFQAIDDQWLALLETCFHLPDIGYQDLANAAISAIKLNPTVKPLLTQLQKQSELPLRQVYQWGRLTWLLSSPLVRSLLQETILADRELEPLLTQVRQALLLNEIPAASHLEFTCALALQCFNNEYVYQISEPEEQALGQLQPYLETQLAAQAVLSPADQVKLAVLALYRSPTHLAGYESLATPGWLPALEQLRQRTVIDYQIEQQLKPQLAALTPIADAVSRTVQSQYEASPYPRWFSLTRGIPAPLGQSLQSLFPHFSPPAYTWEPLQMLIAGCGTGHQAIAEATHYRNVEILAIDLSRSSLAYARRMAETLGVGNVTFQQADILQLATVAPQFPVISSTGVLHHLEQPLLGWQVLVDRLLPQGLMRVGLYSATARRSIQAAQQLIAEEGWQATDRDIRLARQEILALEPHHPAAPITQINDFYSLSECRDLLFHVQEHRFTLPQIATALDQLGLRFLGFELKAQTRSTYQALFPQDRTMTDLNLWEQFEAQYPDTFIGMYLFWCQKI